MSWEAAAQILGTFLDAEGTKDTNRTNREISENTSAFNANEAAKNRKFQELMSNTAYQRAAQDMRQAGLNPALAYMNGGASSPSGASAQGVSAQMQAPQFGKGLANTVSSALEKKRLEKDIDQAKAAIKQSDSQVKLNKAAVQTQHAQALNQANSARVADAQASLMNAQLPAAIQKSAYEAEKAAIDRKALPIDAVLQRAQSGANVLNSAVNVINPFKGIINYGGKKSRIEGGWNSGQRPKATKEYGVVNKKTGEYYE